MKICKKFIIKYYYKPFLRYDRKHLMENFEDFFDKETKLYLFKYNVGEKYCPLLKVSELKIQSLMDIQDHYNNKKWFKFVKSKGFKYYVITGDDGTTVPFFRYKNAVKYRDKMKRFLINQL